MIRVKPLRARLVSALIGALLGCWAASPAPAQMVQKLSFQDLIAKSDHIFVARCVEKKTVFQNGRIITQYKLKPSEIWKGDLKVAATGEMQMEELGGELKEGPLPIGQRAGGMAEIAADEEVLLFTGNTKPHKPQANKKAPRPILAADKPHIVGAWQGRFTVMRHPNTGAQLVARANRSTVPGAPVEPDVQQLMIASNPAPDRGPDPERAEKLLLMAKDIDRTAQKARAERDARARTAPAEADTIYQFEPLDAVKSRVLKAVSDAQKRDNAK